MCDEYRMNRDKFRIDSNERIVKNTEIDQQWADWLAPTRPTQQGRLRNTLSCLKKEKDKC